MDGDPDIDIEENALIYPRIESIYSDVNIKTEPIDIDEDYESMNLTESANDYYLPIPNKIILGTKPSSQNQPVAGPSNAADNWENQDSYFNCYECSLLFPTQNELDSHNMTTHSFLVARPMSRAIKRERESVPSTSSHSFYDDTSSQEEHTKKRQKAVKSTAKSALNCTFPILQRALKNKNSYPYEDLSPGRQKITPDDKSNTTDGLVCKHCDVRFPNEIALIKHTYELLPVTKFHCDMCQLEFTTKPALRGHRLTHFNKSGISPSKEYGETLLQCVYCSFYLMYPRPMKKHLLKNHKVTEFVTKYTKFTGKCSMCSKTMLSYRHYNKHVMHCHLKEFMSNHSNKPVIKYHQKDLLSKTAVRLDNVPKRIKCSLCGQCFASRTGAYKHKYKKHPGNARKEIFITTHEKPVKQISANTQIVEAKQQASTGQIGFIPKQTLFKCNKCQIHFVKCSAASSHSNRCSLAKGDWKCSKCRRTFTKIEKGMHTLQHQFADKFKVHVVSDKILCKVLYQCPSCEMHFDETGIREHNSADCVPTDEVECKSCKLKIQTDCIARHERNHKKYNFLSNDYIIVPLVNVSFEKETPKKEEIVLKEEDIAQEDDVKKQELLYCTLCSCHFYTLRMRSYHLEGSCKLLSRRSCEICGLVFSLKPYITHMKRDHEIHNLKLDDFRFKRVQDSKVTNPMMPDFNQCDKCKIRFITLMHMNSHNCSKQVFVKCRLCSEKYDTETYKIHLAFHNYSPPKTIPGYLKTSENSLLKFYSCVACKYVFQSYDCIVEHCQKHFNNSEALITQPCKKCKLDYADDHESLHSNGAKFEIYKFDYEKLLTEKWLDGFGSLSKDAVAEILSRSIYGVLRNVRLELFMEGPAERTLYRCVVCEITFDEENVALHITESCTENPRFKCGSCLAMFNTREAKIKHANIHIVYGDDIKFREITFNNENDKELNKALRTGTPKESLKFRKCQQCELFIKKSDYQIHIAAHNNKFETKTFTCRHKGQLLTYKLFKPINSAKKPYMVYKCRHCNATIHQKPNVARHKCAPVDCYKKCNKCSLYFLPWVYLKHMSEHMKDPKYKIKNISVLEFENLGVGKNLAKKRRRYSSDDDASHRVTPSVIKTYETRKVTGKPYNDNLSEHSQGNDEEDVSMITTPNTYAKKYIKKPCVEKVDSDQESEESQDTDIDNTNSEKKEVFPIQINKGKWKSEMRNKFYQCDKCYLFFEQNSTLLSHLSKCNNSNLSEKPLICDRCDIVFHPSLITFHEKLHELVNKNPVENYFYLTNISTNGVKVNKKDRWLYKCKICDVHFLSIGAMEDHFSANHKLQEFLDCEICGLKFTRISRTRHMRIQHNFLKLSKDDIHMEIIQRKIVNEGKINLTAYIKPHIIKKTSNIEIEEVCDGEPQLSETIIEAEDSIEKGPKLPIDHHLYKCPTCSKHYLTDYTLVRHIMSHGHTASGVNCNICGLLFSWLTLDSHKRTQHNELNLNREDFVIICNNKIVTNPIEEVIDDSGILNKFGNQSEVLESANNTDQSQNADDKEDHSDNMSKKFKELTKELKLPVYKNNLISNHIYKCVECSLFYTNRQTLIQHIVLKKHQNLQFFTCDLCGFKFGSGSLKKHKTVQHELLNLTRNDFIISDVFGSRILDSNDHGDKSSINTLSIDTEGSLEKDKIVQQEQPQLTDDSITTTDFESGILDDKDICDNSDKNTSSAVTYSRPPKELESKEKCVSEDIVKEKVTEIFRLYQCMNCKVCVEKAQRNLHVCCSDIQKIQCIRCCLIFRNTDIRQHRRLHLKHRDISRKNFVLIRFGYRTSKDNRIYKCETCSTHFVNVNSLEWHMDAWNHQTKRAYCKKCGLFFGKNCLGRHIYVHHIKLKLSVEKFKIICVSDVDKTATDVKNTKAEANNLTDRNDVTVSEHNSTSNVNIVSKLFKCVECDVYFLTRASYYTHIYKHRKLDATEFIDCNICDLQFLNESLGIHMKSHKDKSFCLDKLLIEEYQPNSTESLGVKTYFAKDNINSKLVSTTTPFDNDDDSVLTETDEQLSVIDSTSDEIPKAKPRIVVNDLPSNSDASPEERTLNQNVEVPNKDICVNVAE